MYSFYSLFSNDKSEIMKEFLASVLKKNGKKYIKIADLWKAMPLDIKRILGFQKRPRNDILVKTIRPLLGDAYAFREKGGNKVPFFYIPQGQSEMILEAIRQYGKPISPRMLARKLLLFTRAEVGNNILKLQEAGVIRIVLDQNLDAKLIFNDRPRASAPAPVMESYAQAQAQAVKAPAREYTFEEFKAAFKELERINYFVEISHLRKKLSWPREVFDQMLRALRDKGVIALRVGDASMLTQEEAKDCFIEEDGSRMELVTWNE